MTSVWIGQNYIGMGTHPCWSNHLRLLGRFSDGKFAMASIWSHICHPVLIKYGYLVGTYSNNFLRSSLVNYVTVVHVRVFADLSLVLTYFRRLSSAFLARISILTADISSTFPSFFFFKLRVFSLGTVSCCDFDFVYLRVHIQTFLSLLYLVFFIVVLFVVSNSAWLVCRYRLILSQFLEFNIFYLFRY